MLLRRRTARVAMGVALTLCALPAVAQAALPDPLIEQQILLGAGRSVALSADGNTALLGGNGAVWVYARLGGHWSLRGYLVPPSTGSDAQIGTSGFGSSVSLSADGMDALIGGPGDNNGAGAAWVFTYVNGEWGERRKLIAPTTGQGAEIGNASFGSSVAFNSSDGNTALIGGPLDNNSIGAAWVFRYSSSGWYEQQKLAAPSTGADASIGNPAFGNGVALSSDGSIALVGGPYDGGAAAGRDQGAAWVYAFSGTGWAEQAKLTAPSSGTSSETIFSWLGWSVALSSNGDTALIGGPHDNGSEGASGQGIGAAWVFTGSGGSWSQGIKLTPPPSSPISHGEAGTSVGLSPDGTMAVIGGPLVYGYGNGAAWVFTPAGAGWSEQQELDPTPNDTGGFGGNGIALSSDGSTVLVGSTSDSYVFVPAPPEPISPPSISGGAVEGQNLTESNGSWRYAPTSFSYQWQRCDNSGANCSSIDGASGQRYTLTPADLGHTIRVEEWATNAGGTAGPLISAATAVIQRVPPPPTPPPTSTGPPGVYGNPTAGRTLTEAHGSWTNSPTVYSYQWQRCDTSGTNCTSVVGATGQTYTLGVADVGHAIRVLEWAANSGGIGGPAASAATPVVRVHTHPGHPTSQAGAARIRAQLLKQLAPSGKPANIGALLKVGRYTFTFMALGPGRVVIGWYYLSKGASLVHPNLEPKPTLIATGKANFSKAGTIKMAIKLTGAGKRMLTGIKRLKLTAKGTYTATGKFPVSASKAFILKR